MKTEFAAAVYGDVNTPAFGLLNKMNGFTTQFTRSSLVSKRRLLLVPADFTHTLHVA